MASALILATILGACGRDGPDAHGDTVGPAATDAVAGEPAGVVSAEDAGARDATGGEQSDSDPPLEIVAPQPGTIDPAPVHIWLEYGTWDDEQMYITFPSRGAPCDVLDRVEIEETVGRTIVTLYQGRATDLAVDTDCDRQPHAAAVLLPDLGHDPTAGREFVNGAALVDGS